MKKNNQNNSQRNGYPAQGGYGTEGYPGGMPYPAYPQQPGYQMPQGYPQQQGYGQPQGYPQGSAQPQGYSQPGYPQQTGIGQVQGYQTGRNYQAPQATGSQTPAGGQGIPASPAYTGQGSFTQGGYPQQQGYGQAPAGYPGASYGQPGGYQQTNAPGAAPYPYTGSQQPAGSYIPQTPYSQGYTSPGYQAQPGYSQGYNAYQQMGRAPQMPVNQQQEPRGQVPLNGGGYVPPPVPVKKGPFVMTDAYLLILSAILLALFALGMFVPGMGILKWVFLALAAGTMALFWLKPMIEGNKRLCYTIVFGLLMIVTIIGFVTGGGKTTTTQTGRDQVNVSSQGQTAQNTGELTAVNVTPTPVVVTNTPEPDMDGVLTERLRMFFSYWAANRQDDMLTLCLPSWVSKQENPKTALFALMATRTPKEFDVEGISGTPNDTSRTVTVNSLMDRSNGKEPVRYRLSIIMDKDASDGQWYVNPKSLQTYENADTPDPSITATPAATSTPYVTSTTVLYYNLDGGKYYHLDPNCKTTNAKYLPFKGHFTYAEINNDKYKDLKPCAICGAPSR